MEPKKSNSKMMWIVVLVIVVIVGVYYYTSKNDGKDSLGAQAVDSRNKDISKESLQKYLSSQPNGIYIVEDNLLPFLKVDKKLIYVVEAGLVKEIVEDDLLPFLKKYPKPKGAGVANGVFIVEDNLGGF